MRPRRLRDVSGRWWAGTGQQRTRSQSKYTARHLRIRGKGLGARCGSLPRGQGEAAPRAPWGTPGRVLHPSASRLASPTEGCESGRIGRSRKPLCRKAPWVRIPLPPPNGVACPNALHQGGLPSFEGPVRSGPRTLKPSMTLLRSDGGPFTQSECRWITCPSPAYNLATSLSGETDPLGRVRTASC